ncbi:hypothetical protein MHL31_13370 [Lutibacter sp. A80]|uniref:glycerophosphodiester phosphodiesterase family protein n=1 Tax=Lutibacter sp. A80 TaxID=2918453 RepID=UPI001F05AC08|nr:glycerophosphodiester phosphodiesterase family protein [Lutibacter sp. A80]UMB60062.1 hypothetical protein MHL31_13370 [Lutibacter sp. A80]
MKKIIVIFLFFTTSFLTKAQEIIQLNKLADLENSINISEAATVGIKPNNQAKIIWVKNYNQKQSPIAFVYLHGFGASSREGEPIMSQLSKKYNANVYMSRLKEHGLNKSDNYKQLTPENYIASAKKALEIGKQLGEKVILVSTSTGGTLSLKLASEDASIAGLIMYSPFIDVINPSFKAIATPEGKAGFIKMNGSEILKQNRPEEEAKYWSTTYHVNGYEALIKMLINTMTPTTFSKVKTPVFVGYYYKNEKEQDKVVSVPAILNMYNALGTPEDQKIKVAFENAGNHVIGCDLRSNDWESVYQKTVTFIDSLILNKMITYNFELQGHRGARGLEPENTLQAFKKALDLGVNTLELDVVISKDHKVLVSHEPWLNFETTLDPKGNKLSKENALAYNIYNNNYNEIKKYDVGSIGDPKFPEQRIVAAYKPLLAEVITYAEATNPEILYNIEIKSTPNDEANGYQPSVAKFSELLIEQLKKANLPLKRVVIQSFDPRVLEYLHKTHPEYKLSFLTYQNNFETNIKTLSFVPEIYSPYYILLTKDEVTKIQNKNMQVIPWTVNDKEAMINLLNMGVDGIITDYPNIAIPLRK